MNPGKRFFEFDGDGTTALGFLEFEEKKSLPDIELG
jgi:hypothetical protein